MTKAILTLFFSLSIIIELYPQCTATIEHFDACDQNVDNFIAGMIHTSLGESQYSFFIDGRNLDKIEISPSEETYWTWVPMVSNSTCSIVQGKVSPCFSNTELDSLQFIEDCLSDTLVMNSSNYTMKNLTLRSDKTIKTDVMLSAGSNNSFHGVEGTIMKEGFELPKFSSLIIDNVGCLPTSTFLDSCTSGQDFSKWFGGDDRESLEGVKGRSVGFGQSFKLESTVNLKEIGFYLNGAFQYPSNQEYYGSSLQIHIDLRNQFGKIIYSDTTILSGSFNGGLVNFVIPNNKILTLIQNKTYILTSYLIDAKNVQVFTGVLGRNTSDSGHDLCNGIGYSATIDSSSSISLSDWSPWFAHGAYFFIRIKGEKF